MRAALLLLPLIFVGCTRAENRWTPGTAGTGLTVLVAPVAAPAVAKDWPQAPVELAYSAASHIDLFGKGLDGFAGEGLPRADDPAWSAAVPGAQGAAVTVLIRLDPPQRTVNGPIALIEVPGTVRVVDPTGQVEFTRTVRGMAEDSGRPKLIGPAHTPQAEASTQAVSAAAGQAIDYLRARADRPLPPATVTFTLASTPAQADVLVDGRLKGTTPCTVALPTGTSVVLRLERQGFRPWERTLTPSEPLSLTPALEPAP